MEFADNYIVKQSQKKWTKDLQVYILLGDKSKKEYC